MPTRVVGGRLPRMLRTVLVTAGLAVLGWLLTALFATGTAAADETPTPVAEDTSTGTGPLGLVGGLTSTVTGVVDATTGTVGQLTSTMLDTADSALAPVISPPPVPPVSVEPAPAKVERRAQPAQPAAAPVCREGHLHCVERSEDALHGIRTAQPEPSVQPRPIAEIQTVDPRTDPPTDRADRSDRNRTPSKAPPTPAAPAVPTSTVSAGHDGPGTARGSHGVLIGQSGIEPRTAALSNHSRASHAGGHSPGLPALSPD